MGQACTGSSSCWSRPDSPHRKRWRPPHRFRPGCSALATGDGSQRAYGRILCSSRETPAQIKATRAIVGVWKEGQAIDREARKAAVRRQLESLAAASKLPAPKGSEQGLVSDFEDKRPATCFGSGWSVSTDSMIGGKSKAELKIVPAGAAASKGSLQITGNVEGKTLSRWAGAMFSPGSGPMAPANLSSKKAISFWAKGDGKSASLMLFFQANGFVPAVKRFKPDTEWKRYRFELNDFNGCDGSGLMGVFFGGGESGTFEFQIDEVRFE